MSELTKLLEGVKVEWKSLQDLVTVISAPSKLKKEVYRKNGKVPIIDQGIAYIAGYTDDLYATVKADKYIIFGDHSEHIKYIDFSFVQGADGLKILKAKKDYAKYLYYSFINFYKKELSYKRHWTNAKETLIPIPCPDNPDKSLQIQHEIVRILDHLSEETNQLNAALQKELDLHQKQYNFYREELFAKKYKLSRLGDPEVGEFIRGGGLQKKDFTSSGVGCIHYGQVYTHYGIFAYETKSFVSEQFAVKARKAKTGDLVIATTSENDDDVCKAVAWLGNDDIAVSSDACFFRHNLDPKYVSYYFQTEQFQKQKRKYITGIKVRRVNADDLAKISIPVPSSDEQNRIVKILDDFDAETKAITKAIQKEIALRNKQYEYYRDRLLSFQSLQTEADAIQ